MAHAKKGLLEGLREKADVKLLKHWKQFWTGAPSTSKVWSASLSPGKLEIGGVVLQKLDFQISNTFLLNLSNDKRFRRPHWKNWENLWDVEDFYLNVCWRVSHCGALCSKPDLLMAISSPLICPEPFQGAIHWWWISASRPIPSTNPHSRHQKF